MSLEYRERPCQECRECPCCCRERQEFLTRFRESFPERQDQERRTSQAQQPWQPPPSLPALAALAATHTEALAMEPPPTEALAMEPQPPIPMEPWQPWQPPAPMEPPPPEAWAGRQACAGPGGKGGCKLQIHSKNEYGGHCCDCCRRRVGVRQGGWHGEQCEGQLNFDAVIAGGFYGEHLAMRGMRIA